MTARCLLAAWLLVLPTASLAASCPCDCDGDGSVRINELITAIDIVLGNAQLSRCTSLPDFDNTPFFPPPIVTLTTCVDAALTGCPADPTPTLVPGSATLPALLDAVAPDICAGVVSTPGGNVRVDIDEASGVVHCDSFIGHYGWVRLTRYASAAAATAAFDEPAPGEDVDEVDGGPLYNQVTVEGSFGHTTQDWRWLRGCWIATGHAFDDTHFRLAPQPHGSASLIAASPLFADLVGQCAE